MSDSIGHQFLWVKVYCRKDGSEGKFENRIFSVSVPITGDWRVVADWIIADVRSYGFETNYIVSHSTKRECL